MAKTKEELIEAGKRWGSDLVIQEAEEAIERWRKDLELLTRWGFGESKLKRLEELHNTLKERHSTYKAEIGAKLAATPAEAAAIEALRDWAKQALGILDDRIQEDEQIEATTRALGHPPTDAAPLLTMTSALHKLVSDERPRLEPAAATDKFYADGQKLIARVREANKEKGSRRDSKEVGTSELDLLDGQIHDLLGRLYKKAREAFSSEENKTRANQYVFKYLVRDSQPNEAAQDQTPNPTPENPTK